MPSRISFQEKLFQINILECDIQHFERKILLPTAICLTGLRCLQPYSTLPNKEILYKEIIFSMFDYLKIPKNWILSIETPPLKNSHNKALPFEVHIKLICFQLQQLVYKIILNHINEFYHKKIHISILNV
jgi:hypothetical protein